MQLFRDLAVAIAIVLSAFAIYDTRIKPIYVCDFNALISAYTMRLKDEKVSYEEKQRRLENFMFALKEIVDRYGVVYKKGTVSGNRVVDITEQVRAELFGVSRFPQFSTNQKRQSRW